MNDHPAYLYSLILGCEVAFWAVLALALALRYVFKRERASRALLFLLPAIDVLLLAFTALDLKAGTQATFAHGLAVGYLGFTLSFGPLAVRWADSWFAHRFAGGPRPKRVASRGWVAVQDDVKLWLRCILAWAVTLLLLGALITFIDNEAVTQPLLLWYRIAFGSVVVWFILGPLWSLVFSSWRQRSDA
jgi:hypothetical protein